MPELDRPGRLSRRAFIRAGILVAGTAVVWPVSAPAAKLKDVPRNRTLTLVWTGREGRWIDHELWNPYAIGANHQSGPGMFYEPLPTTAPLPIRNTSGSLRVTPTAPTSKS